MAHQSLNQPEVFFLRVSLFFSFLFWLNVQEVVHFYYSKQTVTHSHPEPLAVWAFFIDCLQISLPSLVENKWGLREPVLRRVLHARWRGGEGGGAPEEPRLKRQGVLRVLTTDLGHHIKV